MDSRKRVNRLLVLKLIWLKVRITIFTRGRNMDDLNKYISKRKSQSKTFAQTFELGYKEKKIGAILKLAREDSGMTQDEVARKLKTKKSAISRIENHAEDIKLSTIERFAQAVGKEIRLQVV